MNIDVFFLSFRIWNFTPISLSSVRRLAQNIHWNHLVLSIQPLTSFLFDEPYFHNWMSFLFITASFFCSFSPSLSLSPFLARFNTNSCFFALRILRSNRCQKIHLWFLLKWFVSKWNAITWCARCRLARVVSLLFGDDIQTHIHACIRNGKCTKMIHIFGCYASNKENR